MLQAQDEAIRITDKPRENRNDGDAELGSELLKRLQKMEGIWYSDDFYGSHGSRARWCLWPMTRSW